MLPFKLETILWAIDPFALPKDIQVSAAWAIHALAKSTGALTQPVFLFETDFQKLVEAVPSELQDNIQASAQEELSEILRRIQIPRISPIVTLSASKLSLRNRVQKLLEYANQISADLIVLSTHARKGIKRWMMGSFAETSLFASTVPLLVVNPKWNHIPDFDQILYPTDYSSSSRTAFKYTVQLAKALKGTITLFHKIQHPWFPFTDMAFSSATFFKDHIENEMLNKRNEGKHWIDFSASQGISTSLHFDYDPNGSIDDSILTYVRDHPSLIVISDYQTTHSFPLIGSVTRNVVRLSDEPAWIIKTPSHSESSDE